MIPKYDIIKLFFIVPIRRFTDDISRVPNPNIFLGKHNKPILIKLDLLLTLNANLLQVEHRQVIFLNLMNRDVTLFIFIPYTEKDIRVLYLTNGVCFKNDLIVICLVFIEERC